MSAPVGFSLRAKTTAFWQWLFAHLSNLERISKKVNQIEYREFSISLVSSFRAVEGE